MITWRANGSSRFRGSNGPGDLWRVLTEICVQCRNPDRFLGGGSGSDEKIIGVPAGPEPVSAAIARLDTLLMKSVAV